MMKSLESLFLLLSVLSAGVAAQSVQAATGSSTAPVIDLGYVKYAGYRNDTIGIDYYRGIPYAQPPTGELRWQKPRPIELKNNFTGQIINATKPAPWCWQSYPSSLAFNRAANVEAGYKNQPQSEDCLIMDVLVPSNPVSRNLPVLLQIHGGGFVSGSANTPGDGLVNAANGQIIYIAIQYRLGMFGFLAGSEVMADGVANAGLLDQRSALEWVQRNIRAFGGDPNRVTIWGGSAGGSSVSYQLIAGGAFDDPPFSAAIAEYPWWQPLLNASSQDIQYRNTLKAADCSSLQCLRSLPEATLRTVNQLTQNISYPDAPGTGTGDFYFGPVVDGKFIQTLPSESFKLGHFHRVPFLTDRDAYEGVNYSNRSISTQDDETVDAQKLFPYASNSFFNRLYQLYPRASYNSTFYQRVDWFSDMIVVCPTAYQAQAMSDSSYFNTSAVFKMVMSAGSELHAATQAFLYSNTTGFPQANNQTLATILSSYWISFTIAHDPNPYRSANAPFWPSYRAAGSTYNDTLTALAVTYNSVVGVPDPDVGPKCDFWGRRAEDVARN